MAAKLGARCAMIGKVKKIVTSLYYSTAPTRNQNHLIKDCCQVGADDYGRGYKQEFDKHTVNTGMPINS